jgi:hypothetical protein
MAAMRVKRPERKIPHDSPFLIIILCGGDRLPHDLAMIVKVAKLDALQVDAHRAEDGEMEWNQ